MPAYHSKQNDLQCEVACNCALLPLKTEIRGPAEPLPSDQEDIIDEALSYLRANVFFRNFDVRGSADRTLIYLTLHAVQLLVKGEKIEDKASALREFRQVSTKLFPIPGDVNWPLGGLFTLPQQKSEADSFRAYFKQAREELALRLTEMLFNEDGSKNKWWQAFSKRKFMGKEFKD